MRLRGKAVFLSASVSTRQPYAASGGGHADVDEAVISLARAVFSESGRLVFGGHPAISPLVAMVAGEYIEPPAAESREERATPIVVYQSEAYRGYVPEETMQMYRLNYASIRWTEAQGNEHFAPERAGESQCPQSLAFMRQHMIQETAPAAMVCIGGMDGVERELSIFSEYRPGVPIYVIGSTGGASAMIAYKSQRSNVRVIDRELHEKLAGLRREFRPSELRPPDEVRLPPVAYAVIMQAIVDEIAGLDERRGPAMAAQ
jgi:hypothetical protein